MAMGGRRGRGGGISVARLRRWLLAGVVVLLVGLAALLGVARWKARKLIHDLPAKLGLDIKSQANGITVSRSVKGHTLFTLHAAKEIQRQNGKTTLHDVAITIYGPAGSNRTDSIRGAEFEYDQPNGVVKAAGETHLDLAAPVDEKADVDAKRIAVTTSGLIFLQKLGVATTDQRVHIDYGDLHGTATGAEYETDTGILRLRSAVQMDGMQGGQMVHLHAASAELDRNKRIATLHVATVDSGESRASGDTVVLDAGPAGGIDEVRADGHATVESPGGMKAVAPKLVAKVSPAGKPTLATMSGGVVLTDADGGGSGQTAVVRFNGAGVAEVAELAGNVVLDQNSASSQDHLTADKLVAALAQDGAHRAVLKDATATGHAELRSVSQSKPAKTTVAHADVLHAAMAASGTKQYVASLTGNGSTRLDEDDGAGNLRTSTGDALEVKLLPPGGAKGASAIQSAVQMGHVTVVAKSAAKNGKAATETHATASRAEFTSASGHLVLTGSPVVTGDGMQIMADRIALAQGSGDADATGSVRGVYQAEGKTNAEPVHVVADHATVSGSVAKFFGGAKAARMWTSTAEMESPVIELDRSSNRLVAHAAAGAASTSSVHMLLPMSASGTAKSGGVARMTGGSLLYVPADGGKAAHADMTGGVRLETNGSTLTARQAVATLTGGAKAGPMSGSVQQVVASGDVRLEQPGRTGQGERLVYTASDQKYVLTGTPQSPPKIVDSQKGTLIGATLVLHGADQNVEVTGGGARRVHTETEAEPSRR